ncbi:MAG: hypothetical protein KAS71_00860 [Bacteroidales bacterium]|nr:hypothetical protein [Bacteroidales bacterium]
MGERKLTNYHKVEKVAECQNGKIMINAELASIYLNLLDEDSHIEAFMLKEMPLYLSGKPFYMRDM